MSSRTRRITRDPVMCSSVASEMPSHVATPSRGTKTKSIQNNIEKISFEALTQFSGCFSAAEVKDVFEEILPEFGANAFIICDIPHGTQPKNQEIHASGWSSEWQLRYLHNDYARYDPVPNVAGSMIEPYSWRDLAGSLKRDTEGRRIMDEARFDFRMKDGLCVPIHGIERATGLISIASEHDEWNLSFLERAALRMVSIYAYEAIRRLRVPSSDIVSVPKLSKRERECILWAAAGKTTWETSAILGIGEETARQYLKSASKKLDTKTRAHLVARAFSLKLIL